MSGSARTTNFEVARTVSAGSDNATCAKASSATLHGIIASNANAGARYLKIYDLAVAPTVGTSPITLTIYLAPTSTTTISLHGGIRLSTGLAWAMTTEATDAGVTGVSANEHIVHLLYT